MTAHFRALERMYAAAPTNQSYTDLEMTVGEGTAEVSITVVQGLFHSGGAMHGAHYFKLLDDAAFFATNSLVEDVFVLTAQMSIQLMRPITAGHITAKGRGVKPGRTTFFASAELFGPDGKLLGTGQGAFNRSAVSLETALGYGSA